MRRMFLLMLILPASGCAIGASPVAICDATAQDRTNAAAAVAADGGDQSALAVQALISRLDAGCNGS